MTDFCYFLDCMMPHAILHGMGMFAASITYVRIRERDNNYIFMNPDPQMKIFSASEGGVKLQISGSRSLIRTVTPDQVKVKLNLANAVPGNNLVPITNEGIVLPPGIDLKQVEPQAITVNIDVPGKKTLPVQPNWTGKLPEGLIMEDATIDPDTVEVVGGKLTLEEIRTIYTEAIPLNNISTDGKITVGLMLLPSSLKLADESQTGFEIQYSIKPRPAPPVDKEK